MVGEDDHRTRSTSCRFCSGTGRTPGVLPGLVRREPVTVAVATDREPQDYHNNDATLREGHLFGWYRQPSGVFAMPYDLPSDLWDEVARLPGCVVHGHWADFRTRAAAIAALSAALLKWAKEQSCSKN